MSDTPDTGRELDELVHEKVMGFPPRHPTGIYLSECYSSDPAAMIRVVERMSELGWSWMGGSPTHKGGKWSAVFTPYGTNYGRDKDGVTLADSLALATCRAALAAVKESPCP